MVDVFHARRFTHIGYLDCSLTAKSMLDSAFGCPMTGLPFANGFRRAFPAWVSAFDDLRGRHSVGFFIERPFRNRGGRGVWNLDVVLMVLAMETARTHGQPVFTVRPTGDRVRYYRRKFAAEMVRHAGNQTRQAIDWQRRRKTMSRVQLIEASGRTVRIRVKATADP